MDEIDLLQCEIIEYLQKIEELKRKISIKLAEKKREDELKNKLKK